MPNLLRSMAVAVVLAIAGAASPAQATANYPYKPDEYVIIGNGLAPSKKLAIAAHGEGDLGSDNFHLWVMAEPAHKKLAAVPAIGSDNNLDSAAKAYTADWSPDSRHVAITFRTDRHLSITLIYTLDRGRLRELAGPSVFAFVSGLLKESADEYDLRSGYSQIDWLGASTFRLRDHRLYSVTSRKLVRALGRFGRQAQEPYSKEGGELRYFVEFSAEATGVVTEPGRYRLRKAKPMKFDDPNTVR